MFRVKRVYDEPSHSDGTRILVDGLWPRGVSKEEARVVEWMREIAPSAALRNWFKHDPVKWVEFQRRYARELEANSELVDRLRTLADGETVTLVYAAKDPQHNNAVALKAYLDGRVSKGKRAR